MSQSSLFQIKEHIIASSHIRESITTTSASDPIGRLAIKQYIPLNNLPPQEGDLTIIGSHGNGYIKELYEPLWEDLLSQLESRGIRIRSIWVADTFYNGTSSSVLNSDLIYDPVSSWSHSRDLMHMINTFRSEILQPIVGIGHSLGASQLAMLSLYNPALFTTLILLEPIIVPSVEMGMASLLLSMARKRKHTWASLAEAESYFRKAFSRSWDPRAIAKWCEYVLVPIDTSDPSGPTKLVFERIQEMACYVQLPHVKTGKISSETIWAGGPPQLHAQIQNMSTNTLILCGSRPGSVHPDLRKDWVERMCTEGCFQKTGSTRRVEIDVLEGVGHLLPFEKPVECAEKAAKWINEELGEWKQAEWEPSKRWRRTSQQRKEKISEEWIEGLKVDVKAKM